MKILVTGGAGYIGSHTIIDLLESGFEVESLDNFINSDNYAFGAINRITGKDVVNHRIDLRDGEAVMNFFENHNDYDGVIHFAALKSVEESVANPILYYQNNISGLVNLLEGMKQFFINKIIFSSSCTVYGNAESLPVTEDSPIRPAESPYGYTKQACEQMLEDLVKNDTSFQVISLRYFNPAGAHQSGILGENPINPPRNLVPIITEVGIGKRQKVTVFGDDYATRDGSCIRDYIHVVDLAKAHTMCLDYLRNNQDVTYDVFNVGIGEGASVLEVINAFEQTNDTKINFEIGSRRPGDVVAIYSNYEKAKKVLGWEPKLDLKNIMSTAWQWELYKDKIK